MSNITQLDITTVVVYFDLWTLTFLHAAHVAQLGCLIHALLAGTGAYLETILLTNGTRTSLVQTNR